MHAALSRTSIKPPLFVTRVSVEAGVSSGWEKIVGDAGRSVGVEHYGASADYQTLYRQFGIIAAAVAAAARDSVHAQNGTRRGGHPPPLPRPPAAPPTAAA